MTAHFAPSATTPAARRQAPQLIRRQPSRPSTDAELVAGCRNGDQDAWELLVQRHSPRLMAVARHQGLDPAAAEDAVQLGWSSLVVALDQLKDPAAVSAWLNQAVRRHAMRLSKRQRRPLPVERSTPAAPDFDDQLILEEEVAAVRRAVARLSPAARELLGLLFSADDISYAEISRRIGRSCGSIGPTRGRCLDRLRLLVEEELQASRSARVPAPDAA